MAGLAQPCDPALIVGTETGDDAGVYLLDEERAIVVTADFITPVADEPYLFGQVAAANALSDVYAMGGRPLVALALCAFPKALDPGVAREILEGGQSKVIEAGARIAGGHTVKNEELLYGLSVTGTVHPARVLRNVGARAGDVLVLTKPLGIGIITTAIKAQVADDAIVERALRVMTMLNRAASEAMVAVGVHGATDVTGFGLLGHLAELVRGSGVGARVRARQVPLIEGTRALAERGLIPGGSRRNLDSVAELLRFAPTLGEVDQLLLADAQTSGGLLIAVAPDRADQLIARLRAAGTLAAAVVGEITDAVGTIEVVDA